ncbi:DNA methylase (site-specific DNA-methyltransferase adenine-specific, Putative type III restriction-modification system) [Propionibacterium freudenreichii]|uniref:site-specific DNA-methyltransferase n=1 Tax=Propionibacterium freudenreichii TaxID=1744 RepID=UPI000542B771|nr:site-specific DNA-methyltransferase [Propionibacterium freudenreichii]CEH01992.1 DNA methylase (site-specific DNA-methyltransferase adenine-specific, Putative type III restriction-modification system) [Propionibacterium freudenreichii]
MIRDAHEANETTKPNDFELARLRSVLPEYFDKDGGFRLDRLQEALSSADVSMTREGYELKFLGKSYAKYLTSTRTETVMVPDLEHNAEAANAESENLYIVGDNLDALKHLLGSYAGQVKCIYIDPPYNTGSDGFVYVDDFGFTAKDLVEKVGLDEDEAERVMALQGKSSHSAWLTFMYPRLELAKELLADDGIIFISIDDNEQANLKALCDEVFGEQNFVASFAWRTDGNLDNQATVKINHEYVHMYAKRVPDMFIAGVKDPNLSDESKLFNDEIRNSVVKNGPKNPVSEIVLEPGFPAGFDEGIIPARTDKFPNYDVDLVIAGGKLINRVRARTGWANGALLRSFIAGEYAPVVDSKGQDTVFELTNTGAIDNVKIRRADQQHILTVLMNLGTVETAGNALAEMGCPFPYPKPVPLIKYLVSFAPDDALVLDFFSGSATTAHAVMQLNAEDAGTRRHIAVQWPEKVAPGTKAATAGFDTIDQLGRMRIQASAEQIQNQSNATIDYGFRLFRLEKPSEKTLDQLQAFDPNEDGVMFAGDFVSKFASHGTPGDQVALSTWLVQDGFGLTPEVNDVGLDDYKLKVCEDSAYVIESGLDSDDVMALVAKLEAGELDLKRLVVFGYSVPFSVMHELKQNLTSLRSGQTVSVIERY